MKIVPKGLLAFSLSPLSFLESFAYLLNPLELVKLIDFSCLKCSFKGICIKWEDGTLKVGVRISYWVPVGFAEAGKAFEFGASHPALGFLGSLHIFRGSQNDWINHLKTYSKGRTELRQSIYALAGESFRNVLDNPYVYLWIINDKVFYIGYTAGGSENRGFTILSLLINFPTAQHSGKDRCQKLQEKGVLLTGNDTLSIVLVTSSPH